MPTARKSHSTHLYEALARLGIEPGIGVLPRWSLSYAAAARQCMSCVAKKKCRDWLDARAAAGGFAPRFCPNADIFFEMRSERPAVSQRAADDTLPGSSDLAFLQSEVEEALLRCPSDQLMLERLKRCEAHLKEELDRLEHRPAETVCVH